MALLSPKGAPRRAPASSLSPRFPRSPPAEAPGWPLVSFLVLACHGQQGHGLLSAAEGLGPSRGAELLPPTPALPRERAPGRHSEGVGGGGAGSEPKRRLTGVADLVS